MKREKRKYVNSDGQKSQQRIVSKGRAAYQNSADRRRGGGEVPVSMTSGALYQRVTT